MHSPYFAAGRPGEQRPVASISSGNGVEWRACVCLCGLDSQFGQRMAGWSAWCSIKIWHLSKGGPLFLQ